MKGINIGLENSNNKALISSSVNKKIHFSYDGGPLTHNSSISHRHLRIGIYDKNTLEFFEGDIPPEREFRVFYKRIEVS